MFVMKKCQIIFQNWIYMYTPGLSLKKGNRYIKSVSCLTSQHISGLEAIISSRGWSPKFANGLNMIIGCSSKIIWVIRLLFAKMILLWGDHFGKRTVWSLIYFLNYSLISYLAQSQILVISLWISSWVRATYLDFYLWACICTNYISFYLLHKKVFHLFQFLDISYVR